MRIRTLVLLTLAMIGGCATTEPTSPGASSGGALRDDSLDVLFGTEFPVATKEEALARAGDAAREGDIDKALFFYVKALQFEPDDVDLLAHIGETHRQRNNEVMAVRAFLRAKSIDPENAASLEGLGLIYMANGKEERGAAELRQAIAADPTRWKAHNALGVHEDKSGNFAAAQSHYDAALAINPGAAHVLNNRGYSKFLVGDLQGAEDDLHHAASKGGFQQAWGNLGTVYAQQGWYTEALDTYQQIMSEANAYNSTAVVAMQNGDVERARYLLDEAVKRSPTYFPEAEKNLRLLEEAL